MRHKKKDNKSPSSTPIQQTKISLHQIVENKQKEDDEEKEHIQQNKNKLSDEQLAKDDHDDIILGVDTHDGMAIPINIQSVK